MQTLRIILATALALSLTPAFADGKSGHCPPGLAKKDVPCVPPGQAKKRAAWHEGDVVNRDDIRHVIRYPDRYELPPLRAGEEYVVIGNRIVKVDSQTGRILTLYRALDSLLD
ncbi:MAG: RcnB family protein [Tabrizicola sp.]|uniref:RcnB family protein n=1 Tax=Tabrizicola sp. TaxID=2005166 RepID=UPI002734D9A1|nr:RcnB family protein [Tabrizicola sp.]MDP3263421.1 RcnB family protein [Tabrizicola sp.]MDP3646778.1 RcnB family protein [Paracoccaceae bacterium]MDZ4068965.1 RcnB family protein [Tabrizicola sp.]